MWIWNVLINLIKQKGGTVAVSETLPTFYDNVQNMMLVRTKKTADGIFGHWSGDYTSYTCVTVENLQKEVAPGRYQVTFDMSPRLQYVTPHLAVPDRDLAAGGDAGIRIHKANEPVQLEGCIAPGRVLDGDAVDYSDAAFQELMLLTDKNKETWITITEAYGA